MSETMETGLTPEQVDAKIAEAVELATSGLKETNAALKNEKTKISDQFKAVTEQLESLGGLEVLKQLGDGETVKQLAAMRKRFETDEQGKLLAEGKYDEWFDRRTEALRRDHKNQLEKITAQLEEEKGKRGNVEQRLQTTVLQNLVAAACSEAGVEPSAIGDVQLRAEKIFKFDPERNIPVLRDSDGGVIFGKDGKTAKTVVEWLDEQRDTSRHWWPGSRGANAPGSTTSAEGQSELIGMDMRTYTEARRQQGFGRHAY